MLGKDKKGVGRGSGRGTLLGRSEACELNSKRWIDTGRQEESNIWADGEFIIQEMVGEGDKNNL